MSKAEVKTNAMRILDKNKITYELLTYECDEFIDGLHTAEKTGAPVEQSFKTLVGGELTAYNEMMNEARAIATKRMVEEAKALNADAIVNIRYTSSAIMQGAAEVIAYGTAVKFVG